MKIFVIQRRNGPFEATQVLCGKSQLCFQSEHGPWHTKYISDIISLTFQKDTSGLGVEFPEGGADHQNLAWFES